MTNVASVAEVSRKLSVQADLPGELEAVLLVHGHAVQPPTALLAHRVQLSVAWRLVGERRQKHSVCGDRGADGHDEVAKKVQHERGCEYACPESQCRGHMHSDRLLVARREPFKRRRVDKRVRTDASHDKADGAADEEDFHGENGRENAER